MISQSSALPPLAPRELANYGFARVRDLAFDAIHALWRRRQEEGMKQLDIVRALSRDPAWVSRNLRGPGNWTLRTIGELVEALNGEIEIVIHAKEEVPERPSNYSAYFGYQVPPTRSEIGALEGARQVLGSIPAGFSGQPATS
jgi:hypothetical protein